MIVVFSGATLRQRIQMLAVGLALGLLIVGVVGPLAIRERDAAAADMRSRIEPMRQAVNALQLAMIDQESAVRGYVLTRDEVSLEPYVEARRAAHSQLLILQTLGGRDPQIEGAVDRVRAAVEHWNEEVAAHEIALVNAGRALDAVAFERSGVGHAAFQEVRDAVESLRREMLIEAAMADHRVIEARSRLTALVWVLIVAGIFYSVMTGVLLRRWVTAPLESITASVEAVTRGDRHRPIPSAGPPDLARLAANVEEMRAETVRRLDEAVRAREALEQQGPAVVTLRSELAPRALSLPPGLSVAATLEPAEGDLAGDWYDLIDLGDGRLVLLLVDVSGHGPDAGVFALRAKHLLQAVMVDRPAPGEALTWLAERIGDTGERFLTGLVVEVDGRDGRVRYANAGHPPPMVLGADRLRWRLEPTGPLLGPLRARWLTAETRLPPGSQLVAYTDGLVEARDPAGRDFGEERLEHLLRGSAPEPRDLVSTCVEQVHTFSAGAIGDDVTVVALAVQAVAVPAGGRMQP